jgi:hypothetical protein
MMSGITTATREFGSCFACGKPIMATAEVEISNLHLDGRTANVKVVGLYVAHDCRTQEDPPATDEWVEVDDVSDMPDGTRIRTEWLMGNGVGGKARRFVHRDDLPDNHDEGEK